MSRVLITALILSIACTGSALASYAPIKYSRSRIEIAALCNALGDRGEGYGLDRASGGYGCRNSENDNAVQCDASGRCTDYSGDPRQKTIRKLLQGGTEQKTIQFGT
ncbi:MAG: hypothetical protein HY245_05940 [Rhizobiales bacterium]|nr:hypothetical protein [Hyphomicrobiales bacterium]MBI3672949.1 hypothetical protein [Hyphomicrobiales bacterium]